MSAANSSVGERSEGSRFLIVHPSDNVAVALRPLRADEPFCGGAVKEDVPAGHKIALCDLAEGDKVVKYGFPIGTVTRPTARGEHVHSHNLRTNLSGAQQFDYAPETVFRRVDKSLHDAFMGYVRGDGKVGTRNEVWILNTVACVNGASSRIAEICRERFAGAADGFFSYGHPFGCSQVGGDLEKTRKLLAGLARHPNAGGVLVLGLGCENNQAAALLKEAGAENNPRIKTFNAQQADDEIEAGVSAVAELLSLMRHDKREKVSASKITLGVKCGGSDAFSGVTANPLVGRMSDRFAALGATIVMTETPEMFGAEQSLMNRAVSRAVFDDIVQLTNGFRRYFIDHGQPISENPSPGNKAGGLTTLEEKSLGAVQKGGRAPVTQVLKYGDRADAAGLVLLEGPGNDSVSSTALVAAGATMLLFTTGRGTPLGFPAPTVKISSNSDIAKAKPRWIDFDAGRALDGASLDVLADELFEHMLGVASGAPTWNEKNNYREIAIWKGGVTL